MLQSQTREKQQPFFKPLSHTDAVNTNRIFEVTQNQNRQKTFSQQSFQIRSREAELKNGHDKSASAENLSSLHSTLYQEADKIRKWKIQTEIEFKQKENSLQEASQTIHILRKSILDMQLQNENLSLKLQEEISNRQEIIQRINSTRDLCNLLKDHSAKTEERLVQCETDRIELKYKEKEHSKLLEELAVKFKNLQLKSSEDHNSLTNQLTTEVKSKQEMHGEFIRKLTETESQLKDLCNKCDDKDIEIRDIRSQLCKNEDKIYDQNLACNELQLKMQNFETESIQKQNMLDEKQAKLSETKEDLEKLEKAVHNIHKKIETRFMQENSENVSTVGELKDINSLSFNVDNILDNLDSEKQRTQKLENNVEKLKSRIEDLKSEKDMLIMEKSEMENNVLMLEKDQHQLLCAKTDADLKIEEQNKEISRLVMDLAKQQNECLIKQTSIETLKSEIDNCTVERTALQDDLHRTTDQLANKTKSLEQANKQLKRTCDEYEVTLREQKGVKEALRMEKCKHEETSGTLTMVQNRLLETEQELATGVADTKALQIEIQNLTTSEKKLQDALRNAHQSEREMKEEISILKNELEKQNQLHEELKEETFEQDKTRHDELKNTVRKATEIEEKLKVSKETVIAKTKHIKELEKEVRRLKSKLTSQTKITDNKDEEMNQLITKYENAEANIFSLKSNITEIEKKLLVEKQTADKEKKKAEETIYLSDRAKQDKEEALKECEIKIAEMMATLNQYQQENQKMVAQKDKEIELLKQTLDNVESVEARNKIEKDQTMQKLNEELEHLQSKLQKMEKLKKCVDEKCADQEKNISFLEEDIAAKQKELSELKVKWSGQKKKKHKTVANQTDPLPVVTPTAPVAPVPRTPKQPEPAEIQTRLPSNGPTTPKTPTFTHRSSTNELSPVLNMTELKTPKIIAKHQQGILTLRTPQRNIVDSAIKKRRVAFATDDGKHNNESSDTDSSEFMELEIIKEDNHWKENKSPFRFKLSPKCSSAKNDTEYLVKGNIPLNRVPRGPSAKNLNSEKHMVRNKSVKKTPTRTPGKFFRTSPKERPSQKVKNKEEASWFDIDSVFGFGPED